MKVFVYSKFSCKLTRSGSLSIGPVLFHATYKSDFFVRKISWHNLSHPEDDVASASIIITKSVSIIDRPRFTALVFQELLNLIHPILIAGGVIFSEYFQLYFWYYHLMMMTTTNLVCSELLFPR